MQETWAKRVTQVSALLVETNAHLAQLTRQFLLQSKIRTVILAKTLQEALVHLSTKQVDLVFLDLNLLERDSLVLLRGIRNGTVCSNREIPVVIMASGASVQDVYEVRDAGATEFLARPISQKAVDRVLRAIFENNRPFVESKAYKGPDRRRRRVAVAHDRRDKQQTSSRSASSKLKEDV